MKKVRTSLRRSLALSAAVLAGLQGASSKPATAQTVREWDTVPANGRVDGGDGNWSLTLANWTTDRGVSQSNWVNGDIAVLSGSLAGTITIVETGGVTASGVDSRVANYNFSGEALNLSSNATIGGVDLSVSSSLTSAGAFTKVGHGTVTLASGATFGGAATIREGSLRLLDANAPAGNTFTIGRGAVLDVANRDTKLASATLNEVAGGAFGYGSTIRVSVDVGAAGSTATVPANPVVGIFENTAFVDNAVIFGGTVGVTMANNSLIRLRSDYESNFTTPSGTVFLDTGGANRVFRGLIQGGANIHKLGTNELTFEQAQAFTGTFTIGSGAVILSQTNGALKDVAGITTFGELRFNNRDQRNQDRVDNDIDMNGAGLLQLVGRNSTTESVNEVLPTVTLRGGYTGMLVSRQTDNVANIAPVMTVTNLVRLGTATIDFRSGGSINGNALGTTAGIDAGQIILTNNASALANSKLADFGSGVVTPWATVNQDDFATYGTNGVIGFSATGGGVYATDVNTAGAAAAVNINDGATVDDGGAGSTVSIHALRLQSVAAGTSTLTLTDNLNVGSGGVISRNIDIATSANQARIIDGTGELRTDSAQPLYVHTRGGDLTINAPVRPGVGADGSGTAAAIVKSGAGRMVLTNVGNQFGDGIVVQSGTLEARFTGAANPAAGTAGILGATGGASGTPVPIALNGGTIDLRTTSLSNVDFVYGNNITVTANSGINVDRSGSTGSSVRMMFGALAVDEGRVLTVTGGNNYAVSFSSTTLAGNNLLSLQQGTGRNNQLGSVTLNGPAVFDLRAGTTEVGALSGAGALTKTGNGRTRLTAASPTYAAETVFLGGQIDLAADGALGTGPTWIGTMPNSNVGLPQGAAGGYYAAWVNFEVAQTAPRTMHVVQGAAIGGNLANQVFGTTPATGVVSLSPGTILVDDTTNSPPANSPSYAQVGNRLYRGVRNNNTNITIDSDPASSIYRGVAIGSFTAGADIVGDLTAAPGQELNIYMFSNRAFGAGATTAGSDISLWNSDTGIANVSGPGTLTLNSRINNNAIGGTATTINRIGDAHNGQNADLVAFDTNGGAAGNPGKSLPAGVTLNITDGRIRMFDAPDTVAGTVNVNSGATLFLDSQTPSLGTFNINAGGAVVITNPGFLNNTSLFNFAPGSILVPDADMVTTVTTFAATANADIVLDQTDQDDFDGQGIIVGNGRRLTTPSGQDVDLTGGAGLKPATGATSITLSAAVGRTLDINDNVNAAGVALVVGDTGTFITTIGNGNYGRAVVAQTGTVALANVTADSIEVRSGTLRFDGGTSTLAGEILVTGGIVLSDNGASSTGSTPQLEAGTLAGGNAIRLTNAGVFEAEFRQGLAVDGGRTFTQPIVIETTDVTAAGGRNLIIDKDGDQTGGSNIVTFTNLFLANNSQLAVDVQDIGATDARLHLRLMGTATALQRSTTTPFFDDFSLAAVSGANADLSPNTSAPRTLNVGYTPPGTTPGSATAPNSADYVTVLNVYGNIASNVTVNAINGQLIFQDGATLDGTFNVSGRTGDFFAQIRAGQDGTAPFFTGTGAINHGSTTGIIEDIAGYVNEVATGNTPLRNFTDVRVNILPLNQSPLGALLRAERGTDSNVNGLFHFTNVHLNDSLLELDSANEQNIMANLVLDGPGIVRPANGADDGSRVYVGSVATAGGDHDLRVRGTSNIRFIDQIVANNIIVGGTAVADQNGRIVFQGSGTLPTPTVTATVLSLTGSVVIGQGGQVDVNTAVQAGFLLSGDGDLDITAPVIVPTGKRLAGANTSPIQITGSGSLTIGSDGTLAPGASPGTLTIDGSLEVATDAIYEYEIGATPATSDLVNLTGTGRTVTFGSSLDLYITNFAGADPTGQTYVLFDYTGTNPTLPTINFTGPLSGDVSVDAANTRIVLTNVVPEPASVGLAGMGAFGLLARRRRTRRA